jgi:hypothetical protein
VTEVASLPCAEPASSDLRTDFAVGRLPRGAAADIGAPGRHGLARIEALVDALLRSDRAMAFGGVNPAFVNSTNAQDVPSACQPLWALSSPKPGAHRL